MSDLTLLIYAHFLIVMGPALVFTAGIIRNIKRENFRDRRALAESKLARLHDLAYPEEIRKAA